MKPSKILLCCAIIITMINQANGETGKSIVYHGKKTGVCSEQQKIIRGKLEKYQIIQVNCANNITGELTSVATSALQNNKYCVIRGVVNNTGQTVTLWWGTDDPSIISTGSSC